MQNSGSERPASVRKLPSTKQRYASAATAAACPSFRIYYYDGAVGSIPFEWETEPGTPKHSSSSSDIPSLPPLTPPPSHFSFSDHQIRRGSKKPFKKIMSLIHTRLFWLSSSSSGSSTAGLNNNINKKKTKKVLSATSPSVSERVLIDDNEYHLFKFHTKGKFDITRLSSFDSPIDHFPIRRSSHSSISCFGFQSCFLSS
ncbi:unnamed protein product [Cochlearia groenlandica]